MIIRKSNLQNLNKETLYYNDIANNIGNTFNDIGYDFIPVKNLLYKDLEFYKQLIILK